MNLGRMERQEMMIKEQEENKDQKEQEQEEEGQEEERKTVCLAGRRCLSLGKERESNRNHQFKEIVG